MTPPRFVSDLETPAAVVDLDVVERNIARAQAHFDGLGVALRPHVKTHKIPELARWQLAAGATGIACQTLLEAEVMIREAGARDVFFPVNLVGEAKATRLGALLAAHPEVTFAAGGDSGAAAATLDAAATAAGRTIGVLIEVDVGGRRAGLQEPGEVVALARAIRERCPGLELRGIFAYPTPPAAAGLLRETRAALENAGFPVPVVSGGGTPTMWDPASVSTLTEYRVGTYVFFDRNSVGAGAATVDDCALRILTTVVSRPTPTRAILDAGSKALSSDRWNTAPDEAQAGTFGLLSVEDAAIVALSEEHGHVDVSLGTQPRIGDRVTVIPNHCCVACNLQSVVHGVRGDQVEAVFEVRARR